jgi:hypothetical protein
MANFDKDYDKIRDMEYDPSRGRYVGKDGSELRVTPYKDGTGYKYDYYKSSTYNNAPHDSTHINSDLSGNWTRTDNNRETGEQTHSSGSGCYLTSACMKHMQENFDDNCEELTILRWFRDKFVSKEDIEHYYKTAPVIVEAIDEREDNDKIYDYIYESVVSACVNAIKKEDYDFAYSRYKSSILSLEEKFARPKLMNNISKVLKLKKEENTGN